MGRGEPNQAFADEFATAARRRWQRFAEELQADVAVFNSRHGGGDFVQVAQDRFRIRNSRTGLELVFEADFEARIVRYHYKQLNAKSAGEPGGGILSVRQSAAGAEFFSADERLTSGETRRTLLEPVLSPPELAA
jgi:hypothetical protein